MGVYSLIAAGRKTNKQKKASVLLHKQYYFIFTSRDHVICF